jgi:hypothetical protein
MTIQQLEHLADGLSVWACGEMLVVDRTRVRAATAGHDVAFIVAGTGLAPRIHLAPSQLAGASWEEMSTILRRVVRRVACEGR